MNFLWVDMPAYQQRTETNDGHPQKNTHAVQYSMQIGWAGRTGTESALTAEGPDDSFGA